MSNNDFDSWFEETTFPIGSGNIDYAIEAWNEQQATIDKLTNERDALCKQLEHCEAVAYRHTLHMELDQKRVAFGTKPHPTDIFGHAGDDYDEEFHVTVEPLYTTQPAKAASN